MSEYKPDFRDIQFVFNEYVDIEEICGLPAFADMGYDAATLNDLLGQARKIAEESLYGARREMDRVGCRLVDGQVVVPECARKPYRDYSENGWIGITGDPDFGGMGLPETMNTLASEMLAGANCALMILPGLSKSAAKVIQTFGTLEQKKTFLEKMHSGEWSGTMCLTEPHAGSDVGAAKTTATPIEDRPGWYKIKGNKLFISFGDQDLTANIIHLVLARTPGAPKGTKGISLFIVPKYKLNPDGTPGVSNDVATIGIESKMGIHGSASCALNFGENGDCEGELVGELNNGMKYMFLMMNEERLMVGMQGLSQASAAYMFAKAYAHERLQGPDIRNFKDPEAPKVPIVTHPDVRRMLMTCKAYTEGMRALVATAARYIDLGHHHTDPKEREKYNAWAELLTPICKAYCTDTGFRVTELAMQIYGGAGYISTNPVEQYARDVKITSIYEGTNGIQALDLLGRKLPMGGGAVMMGFFAEVNNRLRALASEPSVSALAPKVEKAKNSLAAIVMKFMQLWKDKTGKAAVPFIGACDMLEMFGDILCALFLCEEAVIAARKFDTIAAAAGADNPEAIAALVADNDEAKFYYSKSRTAEFFVNYLLPRIQWKESAILSEDFSCMADVF